MKHKTWINLIVVVGLLALPLGLDQELVVKAAPDTTILYVQPGATGESFSAWGANACELQTALSKADSGDEIWVTQGVYKPTRGIPYASCQEIHDADLTASDGNYLIQNGGNAFQVYCADMASTPKEYLSLDSSVNYSQYTAGGASPGTDVRTKYSKVRFLPETLQVDISDQTFTASSGSLMHANSTPVTSMPYGVAMDCMGGASPTGVAHVDLRETPFAIDSAETFILGGAAPDGSATFTDNRQVVSLQGGGFCGWIQPEPYVYNPFNNTGGPILELEHILPERRATFSLKSGVALYGGFDGTEISRDQRDWKANLTVLSGDIGVETDSSDNSYHVVTNSGMDDTAILDGFTITAGNANDEAYLDGKGSGGGMYINGSSPTLRNLIFSGNSARFDGGGMYNYKGIPTLTNVTFSGNSASSGGGMSNYNDCVSPLPCPSPTLTNMIFSGNSASSGGGMSNLASNPTLTNVTFSGNSAFYGGGMGNSISSPTLTNVTFSYNSADQEGGGMGNWEFSEPSVRNSILWSNTAGLGAQIYNIDSNSHLSYSLVEGGCPTGGICDHLLNEDPQFVDATNGNIRLQLTSPAIDAGDNSAVPTGVTTDLDGNPRFSDILGIPDSGKGTPPSWIWGLTRQ